MKQLSEDTKDLPETLKECESLSCNECALQNYVKHGEVCQLNAMLQDYH